MGQFIDLSSCLFSPPDMHEFADQIVFRSNERLEYSAGDMDELCCVRDKLTGYHTRAAITTAGVRPGQCGGDRLDDEMSEFAEGSRNAIENMSGGPRRKPLGGRRSFEGSGVVQGKGESSLDRTYAIGIPYIVVIPPDNKETEYTLIYLHSKTEDIFKSMKMARVLAKFMNV